MMTSGHEAVDPIPVSTALSSQQSKAFWGEGGA